MIFTILISFRLSLHLCLSLLINFRNHLMLFYLHVNYFGQLSHLLFENVISLFYWFSWWRKLSRNIFQDNLKFLNLRNRKIDPKRSLITFHHHIIQFLLNFPSIIPNLPIFNLILYILLHFVIAQQITKTHLIQIERIFELSCTYKNFSFLDVTRLEKFTTSVTMAWNLDS